MLCCVGRRLIEVYSTCKLWNGVTNVEMRILTFDLLQRRSLRSALLEGTNESSVASLSSSPIVSIEML